MNQISVSYIFLIAAVGAGAMLGGAAWTAKLAGEPAAVLYMAGGAIWIVLGVIGLVILRFLSKGRASALLLFWSLGINVALTPLMLAIALPVLILHGLFSATGVILLSYFTVLLFYQLYMAWRDFIRNWEKNHEKALSLCYDASLSVINIEPLMQYLGVKTDIYFPARLERIKGPVYAVLIISMVVGLNFQRVYPEMSALAGGIPALTIVVLILQWTINPIFLVKKLRDIEISSCKTIGPMTEDDVVRTKARARRARHKKS